MSITELTPEFRRIVRAAVAKARADHEAMLAVKVYCANPTQATWQAVLDALAAVFAAKAGQQ